jgi:hypothetical protein
VAVAASTSKVNRPLTADECATATVGARPQVKISNTSTGAGTPGMRWLPSAA